MSFSSLISHFNPRTRTECDGVGSDVCWVNVKFQSTHPHGVRHIRWFELILIDQISIHAPARSATPPYAVGPRPKLVFQSTHPHGVRHILAVEYTCAWRISIHAPARSATRGQDPRGGPAAISIHAPARSATPFPEFRSRGCPDFNPRTRTECDYYLKIF